MNIVELKGQKRETGRKVAKDLRNQGLVPCNFYAKGMENISFFTTAKEMRPVIFTNQKPIVRISVDGAPAVDAVVKEMVFDPISDKLVHIDFIGLLPNHPVTIEVPVVLVGTPVGAKLGGKINQVINKVWLTSTPENLVGAIEVDVTKLEIGHQLQFKHIAKEGWLFSVPNSALICSVKQTRVS
jgi:large subunit ribosomal protein L25